MTITICGSIQFYEEMLKTKNRPFCGNTFLEMGHAFGLGKKIFLFNPIPEMDYKTEMHAMQPVILDGDLAKINEGN